MFRISNINVNIQGENESVAEKIKVLLKNLLLMKMK